ncbi:MAG: ATP-binding protein [Candidatus Nanoarchaeia archaeon]
MEVFRRKEKNTEKGKLAKAIGKKTLAGLSWLGRKSGKLLRDSILLARPLNRKERFKFSKVQPYLEPQDERKLQALLQQGKAQIKLKKYGWSFLVSGNDLLPRIIFVKPEKRKFNPDLDVEVKQKAWLEELDKKIKRQFFERNFKSFVEKAWVSIPQFIAPNIIGMKHIKEATALQLFCKEPIHILLLGDPGTGKTDIIRSAAELSPISVFGLGSGTSGVGLAVTVKGKNVSPGLLPKADLGLACIDELNLMKKEDYAALYNAMEKGFITYDKGGHHYRFNARIRVLATGNPIGDKFESYEPSKIKEQLPFDSALLSRFHLIFLVKKASLTEFAEIAEKIISEDKVKANLADILFLRNYIRFASKVDVEIPQELADKIKNFVTSLKEKEAELPFEITPRIVIGITRLAKASARMELRSIVEGKDLERVFSIVTKAYSANI